MESFGNLGIGVENSQVVQLETHKFHVCHDRKSAMTVFKIFVAVNGVFSLQHTSMDLADLENWNYLENFWGKVWKFNIP